MDERFEQERLQQIKDAISLARSIYVVPLYLFFSIFDYFYFRQFFYQFLFLRVFAITSTYLLTGIAKNKKLKSLELILVWWAVIGCALPLLIMLIFLKDSSSSYYAGLILVVIGINTTFRFSWEKTFALNAFIAIAYIGISLFINKDILINEFPITFSFFISVSIISLAGKYFYEKLQNVNFKLRLELENELKNRDVIIEIKSNEATRLSLLSKQFSPQVLELVQHGKLNLNDAPSLSPICIGFIDVCESTSKINEIPSSSFTKVIEMFYKDLSSILLKHDVTIDKYLGDGIMFFSNAPVYQEFYILKVVDAVKEFQQFLNDNQSNYLSLWESPFKIKTGIAVGLVKVGFFGSENSLKTYTAIGSAVNLSARLSARAKPGQVLSHQSILNDDQLVHFKNKIRVFEDNVSSLKGFEQWDENIVEIVL